jgi:hypothetical protein
MIFQWLVHSGVIILILFHQNVSLHTGGMSDSENMVWYLILQEHVDLEQQDWRRLKH